MIKKKKNQGEIFGVALIFVVIVIGIIVFSQIKVITNVKNYDLDQEERYNILAQGTMDTMLKTSTKCNIERNRDSLKDLINFCIENSNYQMRIDPELMCDGSVEHACAYAKEMIDEILVDLYNNSKIGYMPYQLNISIKDNTNTYFSNEGFTNLGTFKLYDQVIDTGNLNEYSYKRAPAGLKTWRTSSRDILFEFYLYYR
ncbi:MAG: hypothetical protein ACOC16_03515 [Nanoarchaeota archaeon]